MRGNNTASWIVVAFALGSPPLAREQHQRQRGERRASGITPACAGTTVSNYDHESKREDHPRLRGNNFRAVSIAVLSLGSPPLAREQPRATSSYQDRSGITPACAGTTTGSGLLDPVFWDHPRLRGNNAIISASFTGTAGSPPLAREQLAWCFRKG